MVKLINALTGDDMYVADDRVDEYLGLGHKLTEETKNLPEEADSPAQETMEESEETGSEETAEKSAKETEDGVPEGVTVYDETQEGPKKRTSRKPSGK